MQKFRFLLALSLIACSSKPTIPNVGIPAFYQVEPSIYRGGQPTSLSDYQYLKSLGIKTVLKLNDDSNTDEDMWANTEDIQVIHIPLSGLFEPSDGDMNRIESILSDMTAQPLLIHCLHGEDRTGLAIGLYRVKHEQWTPQQAHDEMVKYNFHTYLFGLEHYFWDAALAQ